MFRKMVSSGKDTKKIVSAKKKSAIYEVAAKKLRNKAYAYFYQPIYTFSMYFSKLYHILSYISAIALVWFISERLAVVERVILIAICLLMGVAFELAKAKASEMVFMAKAKKEPIKLGFVAVLIITSLYSIGVSSYAGYKIAYSQATDTEIDRTKIAKAQAFDSINAEYAPQIEAQKAVLSNAQGVLAKRKGTDWRAVVAREDMAKANEALNALISKKEAAQKALDDKFEGLYEATKSEGSYLGWIVAIVFFVMECLNLGAYWFMYEYLVGVKIEGKVRAKKKKERLSSNENRKNDNRIDENRKPIKNISGFGNDTKHLNKLEIKGFVSNDNRKNDNRSLKGVATCKHCSAEYVRNHAKQVYCTEECRIAAWEQRNNAKVVKGKNGKLFSLTAIVLAVTFGQELTACLLLFVPFILAYVASWIWRKAKRPKPKTPKEKPKPQAIKDALESYCIELDEPLPFVAGEKCEFRGETCTACGLTFNDLVDIRALEVYAQASRKGGQHE
ncbi:hypothetical protein [Hugenholtzia roseola]|uniref:hypothetical protein n=1 Tax=Hugenholtzia roseola TaxID=1002 RepID=UPI000408388D|nr:hypothetical protein [Hugenholtzia roseola]